MTDPAPAPQLTAQQMTAQQMAEHVGQHLYARDLVARNLNIRIDAIAPGRATLAMTVREDMINGHAICHGGYLAVLADTAFAYACNSYGEITVASGFGLDFVAPARLGDVLRAVCTEVSKAGRTGVYDANITNQRGERIAVFRGRSYTFKGKPVVAD